ncbi:MAG: molybdenum cofactor guanylyltransferase MobA [Alphaproteobacteria bacterium]|nr:molybdenum cofactor guanylyltransferase MobA [Alphaproteobacteria bacterium]
MSARPVGVVLAGGLARRMGGGDKCLLALAGRPLLAHVLERLAPQVGSIVINANGDPARFAAFGRPVVADPVTGFAGPLAGVLAGMEWAAGHAPDAGDIVTVPGDGPFLPDDLVARLVAGRAGAGADLACVSSGGQPYPVIGLWPVRLMADLRHALLGEGIRKVDRWTARFRLAQVEFPASPVDPFFNANTPDELAEAERILARTA